jgi:adenylate cyclase
MAEQTGATAASTPSDAQPAAVAVDLQASAATGAWERIKEHKILQWGLGYLGAAIAIAHGQELMAEAFDWPHVIGRILMSVLVLGLPLVLTLAWYHGHRGLRKVGAGELAILSVLLLIAAGLLVVFVRVPNEHLQTRATAAEQQNVAQSAQPTVAAPEGVSLAVLPFVDMSPEHNQEYFSDGLSEELLNQLAQIKELRVTGRTSSFSFKGRNEDLRAIGEKLGVANLLEGSVRKEGNHLRITAQLINAKDGTHLWSQTFDRELTGVFAVQEEIAMAVSGALSITLDVGEMSREKGGTTNVEAYDKYLRARKLYLESGPKETVQAAQTFRDALVLDPNFGRGWLGLYDALRYTLINVPETHYPALRPRHR